jgi:hypothetical protein
MIKLTVRYETEGELSPLIETLSQHHYVKVRPRLSKPVPLRPGTTYRKREIWLEEALQIPGKVV